MKAFVTLLLFCIAILFSDLSAQTSCADMIDLVKSKDYGVTYYSYSSDAISQVTFYDVTDDNYNTFYFAIVRFKSSYTDYIYQVGSETKSNYSMHYNDSAGKAFWSSIEPYSDVLDCGPDFD
jgi:hypothetical protein